MTWQVIGLSGEDVSGCTTGLDIASGMEKGLISPSVRRVSGAGSIPSVTSLRGLESPSSGMIGLPDQAKEKELVMDCCWFCIRDYK